MTEIECRTTAEAEAAIEAGNTPVLIGDLFLSVSIDCRIVCRSGKPHVVAWGSSQPHVEAWSCDETERLATALGYESTEDLTWRRIGEVS